MEFLPPSPNPNLIAHLLEHINQMALFSYFHETMGE